MKRLPVLGAVLILSIWSTTYVSAQSSLSRRASTLVSALSELKRTPEDAAVQQRYLAAFPPDYNSFLSLFELDRELYDGHEYIQALSELAHTRPEEVGQLLVGLSKDAHYDADAPAYLQDATATFAADHTRLFITLSHQLPKTKLNNLITFLADVENHRAYKQYQRIIDNSRSLGDRDFAERLEHARTKRSLQPHG